MDYVSSTEVEEDFKQDDPAHTAFMCILYLVLGTVAIFANSLNIYVFIKNRELRNNYIFHIVVDAGEIVNGISYILTGIGRGSQLVMGRFNVPITIHDCFYTRYWPIPLILGTEIPSWMTVLVSTERIIAVHKPGLYNRIFSFRIKIMLIFFVLLCVLCSLIWAALSANTEFAHAESTSTQHCAIISSTSVAFSTFHFLFVPFAYFGSFVSLCIIAHLHKTTTKGITAVGKKGPMLEVFIAMTFFDIILSAAPSVVMIGASWHWFTPNNILVSLTYATTGFLSLCHTVMNYVFYGEYRRQITRILEKLPGKTSLIVGSNVTKVSPVSHVRAANKAPVGIS